MEKYSQFRDPGTGLQPFLTPVSPVYSRGLSFVLLPFGYVFGVIRMTMAAALLGLYFLLVVCISKVLLPIPPLYRLVTRLFTFIVAHLLLLLAGVVWISVENVTRKRGTRGNVDTEKWRPKAGDLIVSNWVSWIEIVWLASRFNPIFLQPVFKHVDSTEKVVASSDPLSYKPGRRTGTGSANVSATTRSASARIPLEGFQEISLLAAIRSVGRIPFSSETATGPIYSLEQIRKKSDRPVVVFPEATTSNGRALLRFANVFLQETVPVKNYNVFVMCVRYDPPSTFTPSLAHSIPSKFANPLPHLFTLATTFVPTNVSIRLLAPSESPSSQLFMVHEVVTGNPGEDLLAESCASLIAQIGKMKRTGMGWEDKVAFLDFYKGKHK